MRTLVGLGVASLFAVSLFAQRGNIGAQPVVTGGFGNVVFPGGTAATVRGLQRSTGTFVSPLGSGPRLSGLGAHNTRRSSGAAFVYPYPLIGGYAYGSYGAGYTPTDVPPEQSQQQGNITVIYPPQPAPVIINQYGSDYPAPSGRPRMYEPAMEPQQESSAAPAEPTHYLLAFKDHTIYSAVNYWVDGDTLHYFTAGNTHNQASLALIDRDLTARLNRESGVEVRLPAAK